MSLAIKHLYSLPEQYNYSQTRKMSIPNRKALISAFGDISKVSVVDSTIEAPAKNEVQLEVSYSGFSGTDINMRLGRYPLQKAAPLTPGYCCVGRVVANGPGSNEFEPGTAVAAVTIYDAEAERINVAEQYLIPLPADLDDDAGHQQVAALVMDWNTAYAMVHHVAEVTKGQRVFIHGLSGAVGHATMTLCLLQGAEVYGTASARNHEALQALGVKPFVYTDKEWMGAMVALGGAHAVFDPLGFESWDESYSILPPGCDRAGDQGVLVGFGGNKASLQGEADRSVWPQMAKLLAHNLKVWSRRRTHFYYITRDDKTFAPDLKTLMDLVQQGQIKVPIKGVWDLDTDSIRDAHASWGKTAGMGSLLVRVGKSERTR